MFWVSDRGCACPQENLLRKGQRENRSGLGNSPMILYLRAVASPGTLHDPRVRSQPQQALHSLLSSTLGMAPPRLVF